MQHLKDPKLLVDLQILNNEVIKAYKQTITSDWGIPFHVQKRHILQHSLPMTSPVWKPLSGTSTSLHSQSKISSLKQSRLATTSHGLVLPTMAPPGTALYMSKH